MKSNLSSPIIIICSRLNRLAGLFTGFALWCGFFLHGFCLCSNLGLCASISLCRGSISGGNVVICCSMVVWFCLVHCLVSTLSSTGHDKNLSSVSQFNSHLYANSTPIMPVNSMEARCLPPACFIHLKTLWLWRKLFVMMSVSHFRPWDLKSSPIRWEMMSEWSCIVLVGTWSITIHAGIMRESQNIVKRCVGWRFINRTF